MYRDTTDNNITLLVTFAGGGWRGSAGIILPALIISLAFFYGFAI